MKQEFEITKQEMDDIIAIFESQLPIVKIGNVTTGMDLTERINNYWEGLGNKYGFKFDSVEPSSRGTLFILAEPKSIMKPKTQTEIEIDKYDTLQKIVNQLEFCNYENQVGRLIKNIAFLKLKQLAKEQT